MKAVAVGDKIPLFELTDQSGKKFQLADYVGKKNLVIYFYPKDNTPVCTIQAGMFRDKSNEFEKHNALVIGISSDDTDSHCSFADQHNLSFPILSDTNGAVRKLLGVPKGLFGLTAGRVTYIVDLKGVVRGMEDSALIAQKHIHYALELVKALDK